MLDLQGKGGPEGSETRNVVPILHEVKIIMIKIFLVIDFCYFRISIVVIMICNLFLLHIYLMIVRVQLNLYTCLRFPLSAICSNNN